MLSDVDELCDRMGILHDGKLRFVGTPQECRDTYSSETLEEAYLSCISS
jgi:ABC-2 type transport system ATP-binding protein